MACRLVLIKAEPTRTVNRTHARKYPRVSIKISMVYYLGEEEIRSQATIVGGGGIFLESRQPLPLGTEVALRFRPAKHLPLIQAKGKVCYQVPGQGMALEFTEISDEQRGVLLRWIHHRTGNKRQFPRARLATQVSCNDSMMLAYSRDVSRGGMFIETREPYAIGSRISLRFNMEKESPAVVATGVVTYQVDKLGMGVQFVDMSPEDRQRIQNYVAANLLRPAAKKRVRAAF
jgi:uncharacterized protein (TIGR02266 family)